DGHPYALDLDLFGAGGLFELLNITCTRSGEDTLAEWLLAPAPAEAVCDRQAGVAELRSRLDLREELALLRGEGAEAVSLAAFAEWGCQRPAGIPAWARPAANVLAVTALAALVGICWFGSLPLAAWGLFVLEGALALWLRRRIRLMIDPVRHRDLELFAIAA